MQDIIIRLIIFSFSFLFFISPSLSEEKNPAWWTAPFEDTLESRNTIKMGEVFTSGYEAIQDKYINVVDLPFLISESLKQLSSIDKLFKIYIDEEKITIFYDNNKEKTLRIKGSSSPDYWGKATAVIISEGRRVSKKISSIDIESLYELVYNSILSHLDKISRYHSPTRAKDEKINHHGYGRIGITVRPVLDGLEIIDVDLDYICPLQIGEIITYINNIPVKDMQTKDIEELFSGEPGSTISVNLRYKEDPVILKRKYSPPPTSNLFKEVSSNIFLIKIASFTSNISNKIYEGIKALPSEAKGLVIDLRGNQGGLLSEAVKVADLFIKDGIITEVRGRSITSKEYYHSNSQDIWLNKPIVVLIDGTTASAAEVFASAIQDNKRGLIIGFTSYGKGSVQTAIPLPNKGELMLTWANLYTPKGNAIEKEGIHPDICLSSREKCPRAIIESDEYIFSIATKAINL